MYDRMQFSKLASLVPFFDEHKLERIIVDTVKEKELQVFKALLQSPRD